MMDEREREQKEVIRRIVDSPLWADIRKDVRRDIMEEMLNCKDAEKRNELFWEAQALDRICGRLTCIANEVRNDNWVKNAAG